MFLLKFLGGGIKIEPVERAKNFEVIAGDYADSGHIGKTIILYCKAAEIYFSGNRTSDFDRLMSLLRGLSKNIDSEEKDLLDHQMIKTSRRHFESGKKFHRQGKIVEAAADNRLALEFWPGNVQIQNGLKKLSLFLNYKSWARRN